MLDFGINTSCIKSIKVSYETKLESNKRMRGMDEYQAAERETGGEARIGPRSVAPKGQPVKKSRQAVSKRSRGSASKGEPIPKKARRESEAEVLMPKVVPLGIEEQGKEEEEEEEVPNLRSRGLRSRYPVILEEGEFADEPVMAEEVEQPEVDLMGRDGVEIPGISAQPEPSSAHGRRVEVQQLRSPVY